MSQILLRLHTQPGPEACRYAELPRTAGSHLIDSVASLRNRVMVVVVVLPPRDRGVCTQYPSKHQSISLSQHSIQAACARTTRRCGVGGGRGIARRLLRDGDSRVDVLRPLRRALGVGFLREVRRRDVVRRMRLVRRRGAVHTQLDPMVNSSHLDCFWWPRSAQTSGRETHRPARLDDSSTTKSSLSPEITPLTPLLLE